MKKIIFGAMAALLLGSCGVDKAPSSDESIESLLNARLEKAKTWEDSVIAVDGTFMGGYFNYNLHAESGVENLNMRDVERGIRQVMSTDTTNMSYIYGIQIGLTILNTYQEISTSMPVDKAKLMESIFGALRLDSIDREQLLELRKEFENTDAEVKKRHQEQKEQEVFNSKEAEENRIISQSIAAGFQSNPDFKQIGNTGIYYHTEKEGSGELLPPQDMVRVNFTILRLNGELIENSVEKKMFPVHAYNPMLISVLPYMRHGEKTQFFIPYEQGYGILGKAEEGIGPCESVFMTVEVL